MNILRLSLVMVSAVVVFYAMGEVVLNRKWEGMGWGLFWSLMSIGVLLVGLCVAFIHRLLVVVE